MALEGSKPEGPAPPDAIGALKLQRYKLIRQLGKGGFAEVGQYNDLETGKFVAIKRVLKESFREGVNLGAIKELCALQELHHPNIIGLSDVFTYADRVHLVLTLCAGDLTSVIRDRWVFLQCRYANLLDLIYPAPFAPQILKFSIYE